MTESPCKGYCLLEGSVCAGCGRNWDQIANWRNFSPEKRRAVMRTLEDCPCGAGAVSPENGHDKCLRCGMIVRSCCDGL